MNHNKTLQDFGVITEDDVKEIIPLTEHDLSRLDSGETLSTSVGERLVLVHIKKDAPNPQYCIYCGAMRCK